MNGCSCIWRVMPVQEEKMHNLLVNIRAFFIFNRAKRHAYRQKHRKTTVREKFDAISREISKLSYAVSTLSSGLDALNWESNVQSNIRADEFRMLKAHVDHMDDTLSMLTRDVKTPRKTVLFLIHNVATLDSIILILQKLRQLPEFDVIVASINRKFPGDNGFGGEEDTHLELDKMGIDHIRLNMDDSWEALKIIKLFHPGVIFRQSPWDNDIPEAFSTANLSFARLCYTPYYGVHITKDPEGSQNLHEDQTFHRHCWKIFVDKQTGDMYRAHSLLGGRNIVETGLSKYEYLQASVKSHKKDIHKIPVIIWAPHHAFGEGWFNFSTFPLIYKYMLNFVKNSSYHFVFRPHPAFYNNMIVCSAMTEDEMKKFYKEWNSLSNTSISINDDYAPLFAESVAMITDGISFLASYQITGKPLIWTVNKGHREFTELGLKMEEGLYAVDAEEIEKLDGLLEKLLKKGEDPLSEKRKHFVSEFLIPDKMSPSDAVVKYLSENM